MDEPVIVSDDGVKSLGRGRHESLWETNEVYREIANSQIESKGSLTGD